MKLTAIAVAFGALACASSAKTFKPYGIKAAWSAYAEIPNKYYGWWIEAAQCAQRYRKVVSLTPDSVRWLMAHDTIMRRGVPVRGVAWPGQRIIMLGGDWVHHQATVKHEALHVLIADVEHPAPPFGDCEYR